MDALARLRFRVYCLERGFLSASHYQDGRETDRFDSVATHFVAEMSARGGGVVGCVRIIPDGPLGLPIRTEFDVDHGASDGLAAVELSRYLLAQSARSHSAEFLRQVCRETYRYCKVTGVDICFAILEPPLLRLLQAAKLPFRQIGDPRCFMGGLTAPTLLKVADVDEFTSRDNPEFYAYLIEGGDVP